MKQIENLVVSTPSEKIFSDNGLCDSFVTKMKLQDSLVAIQNDSQKSIKTSLHATPVLRKQKKPLSASLSGNSGGLHLSNDFKNLDSKKMGWLMGLEPTTPGITSLTTNNTLTTDITKNSINESHQSDDSTTTQNSRKFIKFLKHYLKLCYAGATDEESNGGNSMPP